MAGPPSPAGHWQPSPSLPHTHWPEHPGLGPWAQALACTALLRQLSAPVGPAGHPHHPRPACPRPACSPATLCLRTSQEPGAHEAAECQRQAGQCALWALKHNNVHSVECQPLGLCQSHVPLPSGPVLSAPSPGDSWGRPAWRGLGSGLGGSQTQLRVQILQWAALPSPPFL